jgi:hypothetical protein
VVPVGPQLVGRPCQANQENTVSCRDVLGVFNTLRNIRNAKHVRTLTVCFQFSGAEMDFEHSLLHCAQQSISTVLRKLRLQ